MAVYPSPALRAFRDTLLIRLHQFRLSERLEDGLWQADIYCVTDVRVARVRLVANEFGLKGYLDLDATESLPLGSGDRVHWRPSMNHKRRVKVRRLAAAWAHKIREHQAEIDTQFVHES